jgi:hypothetical protein
MYIISYEYDKSTQRFTIIYIIDNRDKEPIEGYSLEFAINKGRKTLFTDLLVIPLIEKDMIYEGTKSYTVKNMLDSGKTYELDWKLYREGKIVTKNRKKMIME